jgi:methylmalonyl-CoA/ethylmalonyl-CoA epimerase
MQVPATDATMMPVDTWLRSIDHVGIAVTDLDEAIDYYARAFGLSVAHRETNEDQGVEEAMLAVGDSEACVQLLAPLRPDSPIGRFLDRSGPGIQQVAYSVTDVRAVADHLRSQGIRVLYDEPKIGTAGTLVNFTHPKDSGGVLIELVQRVGP